MLLRGRVCQRGARSWGSPCGFPHLCFASSPCPLFKVSTMGMCETDQQKESLLKREKKNVLGRTPKQQNQTKAKWMSLLFSLWTRLQGGPCPEPLSDGDDPGPLPGTGGAAPFREHSDRTAELHSPTRCQAPDTPCGCPACPQPEAGVPFLIQQSHDSAGLPPLGRH